MIIDFCHKNNEATLMSSFTNNLVYRHISKIVISVIKSYSS